MIQRNWQFTIRKWENTQNNKDVNIILEIQRMKLFLAQNIYAFTLGRGSGK